MELEELERALEGVETRQMEVTGDVVRGILDHVGRLGVDVIAMAVEGFFGGFAPIVVERAPCPVLLRRVPAQGVVPAPLGRLNLCSRQQAASAPG